MRSAIWKTDGSQALDLQRDALEAVGVDEINVYHDLAFGVGDESGGVSLIGARGAVTTPLTEAGRWPLKIRSPRRPAK